MGLKDIMMLNGTNFKYSQENLMITLGVMDLYLAFREIYPTIMDTSTLNEKKGKKKWDRSNPDAFRGSIFDSISDAKAYLAEIKTRFVKTEKSEIGTLLIKLVSMKYKNKGSIGEYITKMFNVVSKLRALKLDIFDYLLVHVALIALHTVGSLK